MKYEIRTWFLPSAHGDIRLVAAGDYTRVELCKLTRAEIEALKILRDHSYAPGFLRSEWAAPKDWAALDGVFDGSMPSDRTQAILLCAPIAKVEKVLTKALRKGRGTISVTTSRPGEIVEIQAFDEKGSAIATPYREEAPAVAAANEPAPAVAATVQKPVRGCPAPDFVNAKIRATAVLKAFLCDEQISDFERHQQFVSIGADTGHRYALTSRHARSQLYRTQRTVYDLDERRPYCVHDWDVPAEEELLTMHVLLSLPGHETWLRQIPEDL